ncbi:sulfatase-like hydrolase/transferase [Membranihabitans maritimus]|uniref:sulfatase-like hydrolase/transferase n=1 Tax=Membranihabitans maritimus TaxID=2904244 RepID=UPI001F030AB5|nr:sulfatase-like hydrolase/transferase [Membranihabitans maritimus]
MKHIHTFYLISFLQFLLNPIFLGAQKPNVVLIMADDLGYECLSSNGSLSYHTPVLDSLASNGIRFTHCISQPMCTPSRVKIMTGLYNYQNYDYWGHLGRNEYTFAQMMKKAGYRTCIAGKWQLNGVHTKDQVSDWNDNTVPYQFGFDEYCLWQLRHRKYDGDRYSEPFIEENGRYLEVTKDHYGPDIFSDYILDFIDKNRDQPFMVYYPMVLVHSPFVPTPESEAWTDKSRRYENDTAYFRDMVSYMDKMVGKIVHQLAKLGLDENTLVLFTGDNGTHQSIHTLTKTGKVQGGKSTTKDAGTRVPLIAYWPDQIKTGSTYEGLIEFSDFFPTLADLAGERIQTNGTSFHPLLTGQKNFQGRQTAFVHYDRNPLSKTADSKRARFVRTLDYKLYHDGRFYDLRNDVLEKNPLSDESLKAEARDVKIFLEKEMRKHPKWVQK